MNPAKNICLFMIVKNEAHVIKRCLESVKGLVDSWVIADTGSTDGTQDIIREVMEEIPGEVVEHEWVNFAHNRNRVFRLAKKRARYCIFLDADETFMHAEGFKFPELSKGSYNTMVEYGGLRYHRKNIFKSSLPWFFKGVVHEFPHCSKETDEGFVEGLTTFVRHEGARAQDPKTYEKDSELLSQALEEETDPGMRCRYTFYLAQSLKDCKRFPESLQWYVNRAQMGGWQQEVYISWLTAARLAGMLNHPAEDVLLLYRKAIDADRTRAEARHGAAHLLRLAERFAEAAEIALPAVSQIPPPDALFVEPWIWHFGIKDEASVSLYYCGRYFESLQLSIQLLGDPNLPPAERERIAVNAKFALDRTQTPQLIAA